MNTPKRPRGRPSLDPGDRTVAVSVRLPARDLAAADDRARDERITFQEWIRRTVRHASAPDK